MASNSYIRGVGLEADIGGRIRELRIRSGVKAGSLAAQVGLSPSAWSRIEAGERSVKTTELGRIAAALGVSPLAILDGGSLLGQLPVAARAVDGGKVEGSTVMGRLTALAELDDVLRHGSLPARTALRGLPDVDVSDWLDSSERLAQWVRRRIDKAPLSVESATPFAQLVMGIQSALRIDVLVEEHPDDPLLGAAITDRAFPLIFVNASQKIQRSIFTLAHELGHVLSGTSEPLSLDRDLTAKNESERFANAFAASLLMPEDEIRAHVGDHRDAESLAAMLLKFGVSFESLIYRLQNLKIISRRGGDQLRSVGFNGLLSQIEDTSVQGQLLTARSEAVPTTPPLLLTQRVALGWRRGILSIRPLAGLLDTDPDDLLAAFDRANSGAIDADYSETTGETLEEAYAGSPI